MPKPHHLASLLTCLAIALPVSAQGYPDRPVRLVVPFGAGGITDNVARLVGQEMGKQLGQSVLVENRPGAGGAIAAQAAAKAAPDGYTVFMGTVGTQVVNPLIQPSGRLPYAPDTQFTPIGMVAKSPFVLAIGEGVPATSFETFLAYARSHPGELNYGSAGNASAPHLGMELLNHLAGIRITHVPYKSGAEAVNAATGGQVAVVVDALPVVMPQVNAGRLRALVLASPSRSGAAPQLRSSKEAGLPAFESNSWSALYVPAGTPAPVVAKLSAALRGALAQQGLRNRLAAQGSEAFAGTTEEYTAFIQAEKRKWSGVVSAAQIRAE